MTPSRMSSACSSAYARNSGSEYSSGWLDIAWSGGGWMCCMAISLKRFTGHAAVAASEEELAALEVTLPTALELCRLGRASMIDIRQTFEIEMKGAIPDSVH